MILFKYYQEKKENINLILNLISNFKNLIIYLNANKETVIRKKYIYELFPSEDEDKEKLFSKEFKEIFNNNKNFTINKTLSIFEYYQWLIFKNIINEIKENITDIKKE